MRSSSDWVRTRGGEWIKAPVQQTRGLNVIREAGVGELTRAFCPWKPERGRSWCDSDGGDPGNLGDHGDLGERNYRVITATSAIGRVVSSRPEFPVGRAPRRTRTRRTHHPHR